MVTHESRSDHKLSGAVYTRRITSASPSSPLEILPAVDRNWGTGQLRLSLRFTLDRICPGRSRRLLGSHALPFILIVSPPSLPTYSFTRFGSYGLPFIF